VSPISRLPPLLHAAPVAIVALDLEGRIVDANGPLLAASGYTIEELRGRSFEAFEIGVQPGPGLFEALARGAKDAYRVRILRGRFDDPEVRHPLEVIERNALSQARLIDDLLDVSRIITGKITVQVGPVDLATVAQAAIETVRPAADARGVQLEVQVQPELPAVMGDAQRLQQVLWNLLSNAVKFTDRDGRATLALSADARNVVITVRDTGIGIAPAILPHVFERFTQGDSSTTRAHTGLGLGLAIVRHLVELHGGTVSAESAGAGRGATFRVWLPVGG
jgi:signal transduction histidine kinase